MYICLDHGTAGRGLPLEEFVRIAAVAGFEGADVDLTYGLEHGTAALVDLYGSKDLKFGGWGPPVDWRGETGTPPEGLKKLGDLAKIARELGIDACATWIMPSSDLPFIENWNYHVTRIKPVAQVLAEHGLRFGLEFVAPYHLRRKFKHEFIFTPGLMLELADAAGPNVGLLVDIFHCHCSGTPWDQVAQIPASRIVLGHLNDAPNVAVAAVEDGTRLLPGDGVLDIPAFLAALAKTGYDGPVSLEVFNADLRAMPPAEAAKRAWQATRRFVERAPFA